MFVTEGYRYLDERILKMRVGMMWLLLLVGLLFTAAEPLSDLPWLALASALFILAFRLWDDLADLEYDREHHRQRCMVQSAQLQSFVAALWLMITVLTALLSHFVGGVRSLVFLTLVVATFATYRAVKSRPLRTSLVLAKYPAFILLLADAPGDSVVVIAALGVYLPPLMDEIWSVGARIVIPASIFLGVAVLTWLALTV